MFITYPHYTTLQKFTKTWSILIYVVNTTKHNQITLIVHTIQTIQGCLTLTDYDIPYKHYNAIHTPQQAPYIHYNAINLYSPYTIPLLLYNAPKTPIYNATILSIHYIVIFDLYYLYYLDMVRPFYPDHVWSEI